MKQIRLKKYLISALSLMFACVLGLAVWMGFGSNIQQASAAGETYTLSFKGGRGTRSIEETDGWFWAINGTETTVTDDLSPEDVGGKAVKYTKDSASDPYLGGYAKVDGFTADVTYTTAFWMKTEAVSNDFAVKAWMPDASFATVSMPVIATVSGNTDWTRYEYTWTAKSTSGGTAPLRFSVTAGQGSLYIDEVDSYQSIYTVTNGSAIGTMPQLPEQDGKNAAWIIDGETITASTVYNYTENKTAVATYFDTLTFDMGSEEMTEKVSEFANVYNVQTAELTAADTYNGGKAINLVRTDGTAGANASFSMKFNGVSVTAGETYTVRFKLKTAGSIHVWHLSEDSLYTWASTHLIDDWVAGNAGAWVDCSYTYTAAYTQENFILGIQLTTNTNSTSALIDELYVEEPQVKINVFKGQPIGTLPTLEEGKYWAIDGKKITADTIWTYDEGKTATIESIKYLNFDPVYGDLIDNKFTETWVGNAVNNGMAAIVGEENKQVEVSLTASDDAGRIFLSQTILTPDDVYTLKFKMKGDGTKVHLYFMPGDTLMKDWVQTTAEWTEYTYTVTIKAADGAQLWVKAASVVSADSKVYIDDISFEKPIASMAVDNGVAIGDLPAVPEREHYVGAWMIEGETINADTVWTYDVSKTAKLAYTPIEYTITFMNGDETVSTQTYTVEDTAITVPEVPAKEHYTVAWAEYELKGGDVTVNAVYTANTYTVTFMNGEEVVGTQSYTVENTAITVPEVPAKEHYTGVWESYELNGGDVTVNSVYTANTYTVTFMNGEEVVGTQTYTVENTEITVPEVPAKEHYTAAWAEYELKGGDVTVTPVYTAIEYTVTFMNGEEVVGTQTYTVENTEITEPEVPAKEGYGVKWEAYTLVGGDITVNAVYIAGVYTVTFKADGVTVATEEYTIENREITVPEVPAKEHYTGVWSSYELIGGDITVDAVYTANEYTVTFMADGVKVDEVIYTMENTEIVEPTVPTKEGYTGVWAEYELNGGDKTVNAVYTERPIVDDSSSEEDTSSDENNSSEKDSASDTVSSSDDNLGVSGCFGSVSGATIGIAMLGVAVATLLKKKEN